MSFEAFQALLNELVDAIPEEFLEGLQGVHALPQVRQETGFKRVYRLGEYLDPGPSAFLGGNTGLGRHIALYYGSFAEVAAGDPHFAWEDQLWDTLLHELRHHVESQAGDRSLIEEDVRRHRRFRAAGL